MVFDHPDGLRAGGEAQHQFDEITAIGFEPGRTENSTSSHDQRSIEIGLRIGSPASFDTAYAPRGWCIFLDVWSLAVPSKT